MNAQILVPLDGSSFGQQALPLALALARRVQATVHLVKVHVPAAVKPSSCYVYFDDEADHAAHDVEEGYLREMETSVRGLYGLSTHTAVLSGTVAPALESYIREHSISLVVMSSHGRGGLSRAWLGSVADALVRKIDVPILMVKPSALEVEDLVQDRIDHILVPLDGSALAEQAIAQAVALGGLFDARYTLLQVVSPPFALSAEAMDVPLATYHSEVEQLRRSALEYLDRLAAPLRRQSVRVDTAVVVQSQSAPGILEEAGFLHADLIVMGTHGRGGYQRVALGSVADKVLRGASVPVQMFRANAAVPELYAPVAGEVLI